MDSSTALSKGVEILEPLMKRYGFHFTSKKTGKGSGGSFSAGRFENGSKALELFVRYNLGGVKYRVNNIELEHDQYVLGVGKEGQNKYPGFTDDVLESFKDLKDDLEKFYSVFLEGNTKDFQNIYENYQRKTKKK